MLSIEIDNRRRTENTATYAQERRRTERKLTESVAQLAHDVIVNKPTATSDFITRHTHLLIDAYQRSHAIGSLGYWEEVSLKRNHKLIPAPKLKSTLAFYLPSAAKMANEASSAYQQVTLSEQDVKDWQASVKPRVSLQADLTWSGFQDGYIDAGNVDKARPYLWIYWILEPLARHCPECPSVADGSPYGMPGSGNNELAQTPGDGRTSCGAGCRCDVTYGPGPDVDFATWVGVWPIDAPLDQIWPQAFPPLEVQMPDSPTLTKSQKAALDAWRQADDLWDIYRGGLPELADMFGNKTNRNLAGQIIREHFSVTMPWDELSEKQQQALFQAMTALKLWQEANPHTKAMERPHQWMTLDNPNHLPPGPGGGQFAPGGHGRTPRTRTPRAPRSTTPTQHITHTVDSASRGAMHEGRLVGGHGPQEKESLREITAAVRIANRQHRDAVASHDQQRINNAEHMQQTIKQMSTESKARLNDTFAHTTSEHVTELLAMSHLYTRESAIRWHSDNARSVFKQHAKMTDNYLKAYNTYRTKQGLTPHATDAASKLHAYEQLQTAHQSVHQSLVNHVFHVSDEMPSPARHEQLSQAQHEQQQRERAQREQQIQIRNQQNVRDATQHIFGHQITHAEIASLFARVEPDNNNIHVGGNRNELAINISGQHQLDLTISRSGQNIIAHVDYATTHRSGKSERSAASGRDVVRTMQSLQMLGVHKITTSAARTHNMNGYYSWPRLGFTGKIPSRFSVPSRFGTVTKVEQLFTQHGGAKWWKENGVSFEATFSFAPRSHSMHVFNRIVRALGESQP